MTHPACFESTKQHAEWLALARTSCEVCSICTDCIASYETEMVLQGRCDRESWELMEINRRVNDGQTCGTPGRTVELRARLEAVRSRAREIARSYLSNNSAGVQAGGEL